MTNFNWHNSDKIDLFTQEDINILLLWANNDSYNNEEVTNTSRKKVIQIIKKGMIPEAQKVKDEWKDRNYRIWPDESIEFPKSLSYLWLRWNKIGWHFFYVPWKVYKKITSYIQGDKRHFTRRDFDKILDYIEIEYWLSKRDVHKK